MKTICIVPRQFLVLPARVFTFAFLVCLIQIAACLPAACAADDGWPKGYVIAEGSESPDGKYGVLVPTEDSELGEGDDKIENALVDLKTHRRLGIIHGAHYLFNGRERYNLAVQWADDSSCCAVTYQWVRGYLGLTLAITLVEPQGETCRQTEIGKRMFDALNAAAARRKAHATFTGTTYFRFVPGHKIFVRTVGYVANPKEIDSMKRGELPEDGIGELFEGVFDLASRKWRAFNVRQIDREPEKVFDVYRDDLPSGSFPTEAERLKEYDELLNNVYSGLRIILPAERFAAVKKEQIESLKKLEAADSIGKKCELMAARIKELRRLVWY
jgi:hypothetical protein